MVVNGVLVVIVFLPAGFSVAREPGDLDADRIGRRLGLAPGGEPFAPAVVDLADVAVHEPLEAGVDELDQLGAGAEILGQVDAPVALAAVGQLELFAQQQRVGVTEAIDALLVIADEEEVAGVVLARHAADDGVLQRRGVLVFVDEHDAEAVAVLQRDVGGAVAAGFAQDFERVAFEVVERRQPAAQLAAPDRFGRLVGQVAERPGLARREPRPEQQARSSRPNQRRASAGSFWSGSSSRSLSGVL